MLAPVAASQPPVTSLVESLSLSLYPRGMKPPEFNGQTVEGPTVSLASLRGRVVLLFVERINQRLVPNAARTEQPASKLG
jgi:hypothetical protein